MLTRTERRIIREQYDAAQVRLDADDKVSVLTYEPRGDGGSVPWWKFIGWEDEVRREMEWSQ